LCFIQKIRRRSLDDITFAEFDHNPNFVLDDILPDVVVRLRNQENCSLCQMNFIRDEIVDSLMEQ
jgi:hypothetical protein